MNCRSNCPSAPLAKHIPGNHEGNNMSSEESISREKSSGWMGQRQEKLNSLEGKHNHRELCGSCISQCRNKNVLENITWVAMRCIQKF